MTDIRLDSDVAWVQEMCKRTLTPFQKRVVVMLGAIAGGIHNSPIDWNKGVKFVFGNNGMAVDWSHGHMETWDTCKLTWLVFMCCDARIRLEVSAPHARVLRLAFWQRQATGRMSERHPNLDEFVESFRNEIPFDDPLLYQNHEERRTDDSSKDNRLGDARTDSGGAVAGRDDSTQGEATP